MNPAHKVCVCVCLRGLMHSFTSTRASWFIQTKTHSGASGSWPITGFHSWIITGQSPRRWHFLNVWNQTAVWILFTFDPKQQVHRQASVISHLEERGRRELWKNILLSDFSVRLPVDSVYNVINAVTWCMKNKVAYFYKNQTKI